MNYAHRGIGFQRYNRARRAGILVSSLLLIVTLFSACQHHVVGNTSLAAPTISDAAGGPKQVVVSWAPVSGATYYNLYFRAGTTVTRSDGIRITGVSSPRVVTGLTDSTEYAFIVTAVNAGGESNPSKVVTAMTDSIPGGPTITSAVGGPGNVVVSWAPKSGADSYNLYWSADTTVTTTTGNKIMDATSPQTISGLAAGTQYSFIVTSIDSAGESSPSDVVRAVTQPRTYLFVANKDSNTASAFAVGSGNFPLASLGSPLAVGKQPTSVAAADVNGDGEPDMIVADSSNNAVSVLLNNAKESFSAQKTFSVGANPTSVTTADVNGDGKPDLIVGNQGGNSVTVLLNNTVTGSSTPDFAASQTFSAGSTPVSVTTADINGDGKPDLIVANKNGTTVSILINKTASGASTPSFSAPQAIAVGSTPVSVVAKDVNGDGKPDLVVVNQNTNTVSVLLNTTTMGATTASFSLAKTFTVGTSPSWVAVKDVNGDGKPDLIVANNGSNNISVLLNTMATAATTPSFTSQRLFDAGVGPVMVKTLDVNGDGQPDMIVANQSGDSIMLLLNRTTPGSMTPDFGMLQTILTPSPIGIAVAHVGANVGTTIPGLTPVKVSSR